MLAQRKTNKRYQAAIYLTLLCLISCSNESITIVELRNLQAENSVKLIERYTQDDISYDIIDNRIVFYTHKENIQPLISLLETLDKSPNHYILRFSWGDRKHYSTTALPAPIPINLNTENPVSLFNKYWALKLVSLNQSQFSLSVFTKNIKNASRAEIESIKIQNGTKLKFRNQNNIEANPTAHKFIINKHEKTMVTIEGWPEGIFLEILDAL
ncbi:hypothetical protein NBRC116188_02150 [Oceaniserpentilla sp. 4NH20-0058]|uniref:hypothetical protein n=1 Tax=Oceaniserpentilla sp. 4NH20-0058 TaxID=3127660 RepID=UPI0031062A51